jgi:hypothetical protein
VSAKATPASKTMKEAIASLESLVEELREESGLERLRRVHAEPMGKPASRPKLTLILGGKVDDAS